MNWPSIRLSSIDAATPGPRVTPFLCITCLAHPAVQQSIVTCEPLVDKDTRPTVRSEATTNTGRLEQFVPEITACKAHHHTARATALCRGHSYALSEHHVPTFQHHTQPRRKHRDRVCHVFAFLL
ncbi:uncharacterized protein LOC121738585 [Aricia agestis]|uniref:uncharacterized protein LOC121738585 n=1 Tax=Aricia agestis TaxID=91739 RepID=UPI001C207020|nr:uncharacterized protein LOC121738585 [Aricia agestis]